MGTDTEFCRSAVQIRGTDTKFGPGVRIFDTSGLTRRPVGRSKRVGHPDMGTDTVFDIPIRNVST